MPFEIFPQIAQIFPGDRLLFTARATYPPPMWRIASATNFAFVQPDFSVKKALAAPVGQFTANGALALVAGLGAIEYTITQNCLPSASVQFTYATRFVAPGASIKAYNVQVHPTNIIIGTEGGNIATLPITAAVGDIFRIELGNGFRLIINGVLRHERVTDLTPLIAYPATYQAFITGAVVSGTPIIPAPRLSGDWRLIDTTAGIATVAFATPSHGSIESVSGSLEAEFFNGTIPGQYKLIATIDPGIEIWVEDAAPTGSSVSNEAGAGAGAWNWGTGSPTHFSGAARLKSTTPAPAGEAFYFFQNATATLQINKDDVLTCYVFLDSGNPPDEIMFQYNATDATGLAHRAYWGANLINAGTDGTPSRRRIGDLPPTNQWVRLEVPASLVDLEGRVLNGMAFSANDGVCSFDQAGKFPGKLQSAEATIVIQPLRILSDLVQTLQPGAKARFQTNYDVAQIQPGVVWSVVSGAGSFSQGEFTAPTAPGTTVVRATASNQVADMRITVPAVITPGFSVAAPLETIDFDTNISQSQPVFAAAGPFFVHGIGDITPGLPQGLLKDDVMLLFVESANETVATPAGWAVVADSPQGTGTAGGVLATRLSVFWRRAGDPTLEVAPVITDPGNHAIALILAFRACIKTGDPWNVTSGDVEASTTTAVSIPGDTTSVSNCLVVVAVAHSIQTSSNNSVSGLTNADLANLVELADVGTTFGAGGGFTVAAGGKAQAGAYGATTATLAFASPQGRMSIALRPALPPTWTAVAVAGGDPGSINSTTGEWIAPSGAGQTVKITASNGTFTVTRDVLILEKFPRSDFKFPWPIDFLKKVLVSEAEDGTRVSRIKRGSHRAMPITLLVCTVDELKTVRDFWDAHYPGKAFILEDPEEGIRLVVHADSDLRWEYTGASIEIAGRVKEAKR